VAAVIPGGSASATALARGGPKRAV